MNDEPDGYAWMDDESHGDLKDACIDIIQESNRRRDALKMIADTVEQLSRFGPIVHGGDPDMELHDAGDYVNRDHVICLVTEAIRQSKGLLL